MKKFILSAFAVSLLSLPCTSFAKDYSNYPQKFWDLPNTHWAYPYVSELVDKNIISGYDDNSFKPSQTVSRAEWAKMMVSAGNIPTSNAQPSPASDVQPDQWFYSFICASKNYMNFYNIDGNQYFKPTQSASREDVTVSLVKMKGYDVENADYSYLNKFKDLDSISNNLKKYVAVAVQKNLIDGFDDGTFKGQDTLNRAEAATLLCRAFQVGDSNKSTVDDSDTPNTKPEYTSTDQTTVRVFINDNELQTDVQPFKKGNSIYCPIRYIAESFGCYCDWDNSTLTMTLHTSNSNSLIIQVGNNEAFLNDKKIDNKSECLITYKDYTYVDLNVFHNLFNFTTVQYDNLIYIYFDGEKLNNNSYEFNTPIPTPIRPNTPDNKNDYFDEENDVPADPDDRRDTEDEDVTEWINKIIVEGVEYTPDSFTVSDAQYDYTDGEETICLTGKYSRFDDEDEYVYVSTDFKTYGFKAKEPEDFIGKTLIFTYGSDTVEKIFDTKEYSKENENEYAIFDVQQEHGYYYIITNYGEGAYALSNNLTLNGINCSTPSQLIGKKFTGIVEKNRVIRELSY